MYAQDLRGCSVQGLGSRVRDLGRLKDLRLGCLPWMPLRILPLICRGLSRSLSLSPSLPLSLSLSLCMYIRTWSWNRFTLPGRRSVLRFYQKLVWRFDRICSALIKCPAWLYMVYYQYPALAFGIRLNLYFCWKF